jgi:hypothetical protein
MPGPVSATLTLKRPSTALAVTRTSPPSVNGVAHEVEQHLGQVLLIAMVSLKVQHMNRAPLKCQSGSILLHHARWHHA